MSNCIADMSDMECNEDVIREGDQGKSYVQSPFRRKLLEEICLTLCTESVDLVYLVKYYMALELGLFDESVEEKNMTTEELECDLLILEVITERVNSISTRLRRRIIKRMGKYGLEESLTRRCISAASTFLSHLLFTPQHPMSSVPHYDLLVDGYVYRPECRSREPRAMHMSSLLASSSSCSITDSSPAFYERTCTENHNNYQNTNVSSSLYTVHVTHTSHIIKSLRKKPRAPVSSVISPSEKSIRIMKIGNQTVYVLNTSGSLTNDPNDVPTYLAMAGSPEPLKIQKPTLSEFSDEDEEISLLLSEITIKSSVKTQITPAGRNSIQRTSNTVDYGVPLGVNKNLSHGTITTHLSVSTTSSDLMPADGLSGPLLTGEYKPIRVPSVATIEEDDSPKKKEDVCYAWEPMLPLTLSPTDFSACVGASKESSSIQFSLASDQKPCATQPLSDCAMFSGSCMDDNSLYSMESIDVNDKSPSLANQQSESALLQSRPSDLSRVLHILKVENSSVMVKEVLLSEMEQIVREHINDSIYLTDIIVHSLRENDMDTNNFKLFN